MKGRRRKTVQSHRGRKIDEKQKTKKGKRQRKTEEQSRVHTPARTSDELLFVSVLFMFVGTGRSISSLPSPVFLVPLCSSLRSLRARPLACPSVARSALLLGASLFPSRFQSAQTGFKIPPMEKSETASRLLQFQSCPSFPPPPRRSAVSFFIPSGARHRAPDPGRTCWVSSFREDDFVRDGSSAS